MSNEFHADDTSNSRPIASPSNLTDQQTQSTAPAASEDSRHSSDLTVPGDPLTGRVPHTSPTEPPIQLRGEVESPEFCGPSSSEYTLNVANRNLRAMGMPGAILGKSGAKSEDHLSPASPPVIYDPLMKLLLADPLWDIKRGDALYLIDKWCDGVGSLYPAVERAELISTAEDVFTTLESAQRDGLRTKRGAVAEALFNVETNKLRMVLAIGRTLDRGGRDNEAHRLFQSIAEAVEKLIWDSDGLNGIQLLILVVSVLFPSPSLVPPRAGFTLTRRAGDIPLPPR